jgi:hypothetical protein
MATVRVNRVDANIDEVFIYSEDPYVNRAIYAKAGVFTPGELSDRQISEMETRSASLLAKERADNLAEEVAKKDTAIKEFPDSGNEEA